MYHACAEAHIGDRGRAVEMAACMIQDNMDPEAAARTCAQRLRYEESAKENSVETNPRFSLHWFVCVCVFVRGEFRGNPSPTF